MYSFFLQSVSASSIDELPEGVRDFAKRVEATLIQHTLHLDYYHFSYEEVRVIVCMRVCASLYACVCVRHCMHVCVLDTAYAAFRLLSFQL
jgi:hypothetical protein